MLGLGLGLGLGVVISHRGSHVTCQPRLARAREVRLSALAHVVQVEEHLVEL